MQVKRGQPVKETNQARPCPGSKQDCQARLQRRFRRQQAFAASTSPLYARLWGLVADWLEPGSSSDPLAAWLVQAGADRASFDVPMLLLAGLHRDILAGCPQVTELARYFPTVGGKFHPEAGDIGACLRQAVLARQEALGNFLRTATVQTNESARGLCWFLPVLYTRWSAMHLVDLGASAGLNLVAEQRHYRLFDSPTKQQQLDLGTGAPPQFTVAGKGGWVPPLQTDSPTLCSRIGVDLAPFTLRSKQDEQTLAAFIWGDQVERLARLREGIAALHRVNRSTVPVTLFAANLPDDLPYLLTEQISLCPEAPALFCTTYLTAYLHDKGASLRTHLATWAGSQPQAVLWLQWEPFRQGPEPPFFGWLAWTADLWHRGQHHRWHLAWVHPHGLEIHWLPGLAAWADFWRR